MNNEGRRSGKPAAWVLEHLNTAVLVFDGDLRLVNINPAGELLFGHSARHAIGLRIEDLMENAEEFASRLAQALDNSNSYTHRGCTLRFHDKRSVLVDCTVTPLGGADGRDAVLVELQQMDRHQRIAQEEHLLSQQRATQALVRGLAHEIKNPLGGLRGAAQLLEQELNDPELREYTQIIIGEADRLQNLVNRMLGPNSIPRKQPTNIHEVLERVRGLVQAENDASIRIYSDYDPSIPDLWADPELLIQAVLNIVRNAAQALEGKGEIVLRTRAQGPFAVGYRRHKLVARVDVIDNGRGITEEMMEQIFYPMVTTRSEGSGLGLSIAQSLVNQHGGLIECRSTPGKTIFTILLPVESEDEQY
jgi:two-component system nitrogen regulation sensor histidine kinase GlnL